MFLGVLGILAEKNVSILRSFFGYEILKSFLLLNFEVILL
jgi:hypothetical protein